VFESMLVVADAKFVALGAVFAYMTLWWIAALALRRNDIADVAWGLGFPVVGIALIVSVRDRVPPVLVLLTALTVVWGVRLAWHIGSRRRGSSEDFRYVQMREKWGTSAWWRAYLQVFLLQGVFMLMISSPLIVAAAAPPVPLGLIAWIGAGVWLVGIVFEAVADAQLAAFKHDPANKGRVMDRGLWSWSRHPNYFGESLLWWGVWIACLGAPWGWIAVVGPVTITFLLLKVSGVPLLEKHYEGNEAYQAYARRTSVLVPLPPKKS
jgi:steroid 5-alpha reductase family enzyme